MTWRIIKDEASQTAALVSDDPLYALGPVIEADTADEAAEAIEAFAVACDPSPDEQPTIRLMAEWQSYVQYLAELQQRALTDPQEAAAGDPGPDPDQMSVDDFLAEERAQDAPPPDPTGAGGTTQSDAPAAGNGPPPIASGASDPPAPAPDDAPDCWCCGGAGSLHIAGQDQECNVCHGKGRLLGVA